MYYRGGVHGKTRSWGEDDLGSIARSAETAESYRCAPTSYRGISRDIEDEGGIYWRSGWSNSLSFSMVVPTWLKQQLTRYSYVSPPCFCLDVHGDKRPLHLEPDHGHLAHHLQMAAQALHWGY